MIGAHCQVYKFTRADSQDCRCTLPSSHVHIGKCTSLQVYMCTLPNSQVHIAKFRSAHCQVYKFTHAHSQDCRCTLTSAQVHIAEFVTLQFYFHTLTSFQVYKCALSSFSTMQVHIAKLYKFTNAPSIFFPFF